MKNPNARRSQAVNQIAAGSRAGAVPHRNADGEPGRRVPGPGRDTCGRRSPRPWRPQHGVIGVEAFRRAAAPVYLRRNQQDVLTELPELVQVDEWEEFGAEDGAAYGAAVQRGQLHGHAPRRVRGRRTARLGQARPGCWRSRRGDGERAKGRGVLVLPRRARRGRAALGPGARGPITGSTSTIERQRIVDRFTTSPTPAVLVCQIEAGGVGLNIQAASVVILCEPQVKPSTEAQAVARAHRMGQVRTVQVHRLLIADSVDQRMLEILGSKAQLFDAYVRHSAIAEASAGRGGHLRGPARPHHRGAGKTSAVPRVETTIQHEGSAHSAGSYYLGNIVSSAGCASAHAACAVHDHADAYEADGRTDGPPPVQAGEDGQSSGDAAQDLAEEGPAGSSEDACAGGAHLFRLCADLLGLVSSRAPTLHRALVPTTRSVAALCTQDEW